MRSSSASQRLADFKSGLLCIKDLVEEKVFDLKRLLLRQMSIARTDRIDRIKEISVRRKTRNHKLIPFFVYSCQKYLKIQRMTLLREAFADVLMKSLNNDRTKQNNALLGSKSSRRDNEKGMQEVRQNLKDKFDNLRKNGHKENETNEAGLSRNLSTNNICRKTRGRSQSSKSLVKNKSQANIVGRAAKTPTRSNLSKLAEDEDATLQEKLKKPKIKMISRDKSVSLLNSQKDAHGIVNEGQESDEASVNNLNFGLNRSFGLQAPSAQSKASEKNHSMLADSGKKQAKGLKKPEAKRQSVKLDKGLLLLNTLFSRKIRSHRNNLVQGMKRAAEHKLKRIAALSKRKNFLSFEKALMIVKMGHLEYSFAGLKQFQKSEKPNQEWKAMIRRVLRKEVIESLLGCWSLRIEGLNKVRQLMAEKELHTKQLVINSIRLKGKQATTKYILYLNDFLSLLIKRKALGPAFYFLKFDHPRIVRNNGRVANSFFTKINRLVKIRQIDSYCSFFHLLKQISKSEKSTTTRSLPKVASEIPRGHSKSRQKLGTPLQANQLGPIEKKTVLMASVLAPNIPVNGKNSQLTEEISEDATFDEASFSKGNNGIVKKNKGSTSMAAIEKDFKRMDRFISALTNTTKGHIKNDQIPKQATSQATKQPAKPHQNEASRITSRRVTDKPVEEPTKTQGKKTENKKEKKTETNTIPDPQEKASAQVDLDFYETLGNKGILLYNELQSTNPREFEAIPCTVPPKLEVMEVRDSQDSEYFLDLAATNLELKKMDSHDYSVLNMDPIFANIDDRLATFSSDVRSPGVMPIDAKPKNPEQFNSESLVDYFSFQRSLNDGGKIVSIKTSQEKCKPEVVKPVAAKGNNKENKSKNSFQQSAKDQGMNKRPGIMAKPDLKTLKSKAVKSKVNPPEEKIFKSKDNTLDSISVRRDNTSLRYANYDSCSEEEPDELEYLTIVKQSDSKL